jgi:hypothetical protein
MRPPLHGGGQGFEALGSTNEMRDLQVKHDITMSVPNARGALVLQPCSNAEESLTKVIVRDTSTMSSQTALLKYSLAL